MHTVGGNIMRTLLIISLLIKVSSSFGQAFSFPILEQSGKELKEFIPVNWSLKDSCIGDINHDNLPDLAIVIEFKDTIDETRPDSSDNIGSPRILLVYLKNPSTDRFNLFSQNNTFIFRSGEGGMNSDPYGKISIENSILVISYLFTRGHAEYKFRYQGGDIFLIGATTGGVNRNEIDYWDINFLTRRAKHEWGDISDDKLKTKWLIISNVKLKKLRNLLMPFVWQIFPDVYI
jgi:hypothetical protein